MGQFGQQQGEHAPNFEKDYPAEVLTPEEVTALISRCGQRSPTGIRNRALLMLLYRSGIRIELRPVVVKVRAGSWPGHFPALEAPCL